MAEDFPGDAVDKNLPANVGAQVRSLNQEDSEYQGATKPMCHSYWARALEPTSRNY